MLLVFCLFISAETIIPVCPPACGQAKYGTGAIPVSSGPLIALVMLTVALYK